jgi:hypothetical protein
MFGRRCASSSANSQLSDEEQKRASDIFDSVNDVDVDVENYIVDLHAKIITKLDCSGAAADRMPDYFEAAQRRPNHHHLEVVWSRAKDLVLVNHTNRRDGVTFCAVPIRDGEAGPAVDVRGRLDEALTNLVAKSFPKAPATQKMI